MVIFTVLIYIELMTNNHEVETIYDQETGKE
jgi:hypothetical protein